MAKAMSPNLFQKALQKKSRLKAIATPEKKGRGRPKSDDPAITFPTTLKQSEANAISEFADKLNLGKYTLGAYLLRHGLKQLRSGELVIKTEKPTRAKIAEK
jgi:hypothetical protein